MSDGIEQQRRIEDRDKMLNTRLDQMDRDQQGLSILVTKLESSLAVVKLEQTHLKELFDARLRVIEQGQALQLSEMKAISVSLSAMSSEPEKTPGGRALRTDMQSLSASIEENRDSLDEMKTWKNQVNGVLFALKWVGAGGLLSLLIWVFKAIKLIP